MSQPTRPKTASFPYLFILSLLVTLTIYILRGIGILSFLPGGIILVLIAISIVLGIFYSRQGTRRF